MINLLKTLKQRLSSFFSTHPRIRFWTYMFLYFIAGYFIYFTYALFSYEDEFLAPDTEEEYSYENCNVRGIELRGEIFTYLPYLSSGEVLEGYEDTVTSETVMAQISESESNDEFLATLIEVDSFGGSPAAAEEIMEEIRTAKKPVIAYVRESATSAAYLSILPADYIFGLKSSNIGSIGATQSYIENTSFNQKEGFTFVELNTGKFKDAGNPDKKITQEERELFMRDLNIIHENFIKSVSELRNIPLEKVRSIADGSSVLGEQALALGLIDEIGGYDEAIKKIEVEIGETAEVCW